MPDARSHEADFCLPRDQQQLTPAAYQKALQLRDQIRFLLEEREGYIRRKGLDPQIHLPMGNWKLGGGLYAACRTVMKGDYQVLNHLRLFSQIFTGYKLLTLSGGPGLPIPNHVPVKVNERLAELAATPDGCVSAYQKTVENLPDFLHITPPHALGEVGWLVDGKIVNHDTLVYLERILLLAECGLLGELRQRDAPVLTGDPGRPRILEIGSGYGGLAYQIKKIVPNARYFCVDIPESLLFSSIYLSTLFENEDNVLISPENLRDLDKQSSGLTFVPNYLFDLCCKSGLKFDLVINTLSMSEMVEKQVRYYCAGIARLLGRRGVFFEQNQDNRPCGFLFAKLVIADCLPYCCPLASPARALTQGHPHLWAVNPVLPYTWQATKANPTALAAPQRGGIKNCVSGHGSGEARSGNCAGQAD
jgi:hypothetical protein